MPAFATVIWATKTTKLFSTSQLHLTRMNMGGPAELGGAMFCKSVREAIHSYFVMFRT
jgi:hypothetical protein